MKFKYNNIVFSIIIAFSASGLTACNNESNSSTLESTGTTESSVDSSLKFDVSKSQVTTVNLTVDGQAIKVTQYRIVYVAKPIKMASTQATLGGGTTTISDPYAYQTLIISIPEGKENDQKTAMYLQFNNGGWWASPVKTNINEGANLVSTNDTDNYGAALKAGYIVVDVGTRGRGIRSYDGTWAGKAPAVIVDAKAAIRYLRLNDTLLPGSAEKIIITGTSGGGGLISTVAASGNSPDYLSYLAEIGAAGVRGSGTSLTSTVKDNVFAVVAYCPINNLANADLGYEWQYNASRNDSNTGNLNGVSYSAGPQLTASKEIAEKFPMYLQTLNLKLPNGQQLTAENMPDQIKEQIKSEIERQLAKGTPVPNFGENFVSSKATLVNDWLKHDGSKVTEIDYQKFLNYVAANQALKTVVAFDAVGVNGNTAISGETNLFGDSQNEYNNFTQWSWDHNSKTADSSGQDDTGLSWENYLNSNSSTANLLKDQLKMVNPIAYLNTTTDTAPYWYIRHGMLDRDTSFAMQMILYYAVTNDPKVKDTNFKLPYLTGHAGNYDVQEAFKWINEKLNTTQ
ncbi:subtype B tannase [Acinetobacter baumannii]|uniref:subtype B tannase n=1 Tax=Acinetobacter baumannii TaxID=470 RepID=UPI002446EC6F|nr:subtype B tannase [Acinetobacter baumannii]MDH2494150.1 subtype B tannase [Acinetobacter baumannii]